MSSFIISYRQSGISINVLGVKPAEVGVPLRAAADDPRVILTPHVTWGSLTAMRDLRAQVIAKIEAFCAAVRSSPDAVRSTKPPNTGNTFGSQTRLKAPSPSSGTARNTPKDVSATRPVGHCLQAYDVRTEEMAKARWPEPAARDHPGD